MHHWQVAQTVSHVMLDHMSSSGVMCGEEMVKHEEKKKNIAAVHAWYRNKWALIDLLNTDVICLF